MIYSLALQQEEHKSHATYLLTEVFAEARDNKSQIYVASLAIQKAFDVVPQEILLRKLFLDGLPGTWWLLKKDGYNDIETKVVWHSEKGDPFKLLQGVSQGALGCTSDFKESTDDSTENLTFRHVLEHFLCR